jgi:sec-independent protein translocase protein TatA
MGNIGFREILVILLFVVLIFGARRIPELARSMGRGIGEFKAGLKDQPPSTPPQQDTPKKPEEHKG